MWLLRVPVLESDEYWGLRCILTKSHAQVTCVSCKFNFQVLTFLIGETALIIELIIMIIELVGIMHIKSALKTDYKYNHSMVWC